MIPELFDKQMRMRGLPSLERLNGRLMIQGLLRKLLVVEQRVAMQRGFQLFAGPEVVRLQHLLDPAVEALDHAVGLRVLRRGQAMVDGEVGAEPVELVLAGGAALAQAEQAVGELFAVVGQHRPDAHRAGPFEIAQEAAGIGGGLGPVDRGRTPSGSPGRWPRTGSGARSRRPSAAGTSRPHAGSRARRP